MLADFISTLTIKRWLAIGVIVAIAVITGYFLLSSSSETNKGSLVLLGGDAKQDSPFKTALDKAPENATPSENDTVINVVKTASQPAKAEIAFPSENGEYTEILKITLKAVSPLRSPLNRITFTTKGELDPAMLEIVVANGLNATAPQSAATINISALNLAPGDNVVTVKARAKAGVDTAALTKKFISLSLTDASAIEANTGFSLTASPEAFPIQSAIFGAKVAVNPEAVNPKDVLTIDRAEEPANDKTPAVDPVVPDKDQQAPQNDVASNSTGTITKINTAGSTTLSADPTVKNEILKFVINTETPQSVSSLRFHIDLISDGNVNENFLNFDLYDARDGLINKNEAVINADHSILFTLDPAFATGNNPITLKVSAREEHKNEVQGKTLKVDLVRNEDIGLSNLDALFAINDAKQFPIASQIFTFEARAANEARACEAARPCEHTVQADQLIAARTLPPGNQTETTVFGFTFEPSAGAILSELSVMLDDTAAEPKAPLARLRAYLSVIEMIDGQERETLLAGPVDGANGGFLFNNFVKPLNPDSATRFFVKVKIGEDRNAVVAQNFIVKISNPSAIKLNSGHVAVLADGSVKSSMMSIEPASCPDGQTVINGTCTVPVEALVCEDTQHEENGLCVPNEVALDPAIDVCPNINGPQDRVPDGYKIDEQNQCVVVVDMCPLSPDGVQEVIPAGMVLTQAGECVNVIPEGQQQDPQNQTPAPDQIFDCRTIDMFNYTGPERPDVAQNSCIPCESALYISSNKSCEAPVVAGSNGNSSYDRTAGNSNSGANTRNAAFEGAANGQVSAGSMNLAQSQRLTYVPERGNTGPDILIYLLGGGFAPAIAFGLRRKK